MTPIQPVTTIGCKYAEETFKKFSNWFIADIKYNGERVQMHKNGENLAYFSINSKPILDYVIAPFKKHLKTAMSETDQLIIDGETDIKKKCPVAKTKDVKGKDKQNWNQKIRKDSK